jgi:hypothetical protein
MRQPALIAAHHSRLKQTRAAATVAKAVCQLAARTSIGLSIHSSWRPEPIKRTAASTPALHGSTRKQTDPSRLWLLMGPCCVPAGRSNAATIAMAAVQEEEEFGEEQS